MKKICIISIRGSIVYDGMGSCVPDSICEVVKKWIQERDDKYEFSYHRVNLHGKKNPRRNLQSIKDADILLFISYSEFIYHIKNRIKGHNSSPKGMGCLMNISGSNLCYFDTGGDFAIDLENRGSDAQIDFTINELKSLFGSMTRRKKFSFCAVELHNLMR